MRSICSWSCASRRSRSASARLRSVMFLLTPIRPIDSPVASRSGILVVRYQIGLPAGSTLRSSRFKRGWAPHHLQIVGVVGRGRAPR